MLYLKAFPERPYQRIVIILEIFPEYGLVKRNAYLAKRIETVDSQKIINIQDLFNRIESLKKSGRRTVLFETANNIQLALDLERADQLDRKIMEKYGILHLKTPKGFS